VERRLPLEGVRITDFCWWGVGAYCTRVLANLGAEVVRIESHARIDPTRGSPPIGRGKTGLNVSGYFNNFNPTKLGITLNADLPKGREVALRLVKVSDIVTDSFTPHVMEKWGLTYENLVKVKPDIIVASLPVMGKTGPFRGWGAYGHQLEAVAGLAHLTGFPSRPPLGSGEAWPDFTCNPYHAASAILAALHYRNRTGRGQYIEIAQLESTVCVTETAILDYAANGRVQGRQGNCLLSAAPHGAYCCRGEDRWCAIAVFTDEEWNAFCQVLGNPAWANDPRFATLLGRKENEEELDRLINEWTEARTAEEVMLLLQRAGVAAGVVQNGEDLLVRDPQLRARGFFWVFDHPEAGKISYDGLPFKLSATPGRLRRSHLLGEYNDFVYKEILGMSEEEVNQCFVEGVFS